MLKYRPYHTEKPLSCSLNNCEMFSCILGMEDETALSIIDPVTLNIELNKDNILEVSTHVIAESVCDNHLISFRLEFFVVDKSFYSTLWIFVNKK